ncbi:hypothetical protein ACFXC6_09280, partial [Streptomyces rubiginosohelvolus]
MTSSDVTTEPAPHGDRKRTARPSRGWLKILGAAAAVLALLFGRRPRAPGGGGGGQIRGGGHHRAGARRAT